MGSIVIIHVVANNNIRVNVNSQYFMNKKTSSRKHSPAHGTMTIDNLETARVLSDPFKLKILQHFVEQPRTTKQVADLMGEKAPRLYRHVDSLLEHGILDIIEEKPKRGTIERYLQTVAARFEVDRRLFSPDNDKMTQAHTAVQDILRSTGDEFIQAMSRHPQTHSNASDADDLEPIMLKMTANGSRAQLIELRQRMLDLVEGCQDKTKLNEQEEMLTYQGFIAFYPMIDSLDD